jgi:protein O-mannosyl-transferase
VPVTASPGRPPFLLPSWGLCLLVLVFCGLGWLLQSPGFHEPMVYDSRELLANKIHVFATHDLRNVIAIVPVRPLFMLSLYANYLWAGMDPYHFRVVNAAILAVAGVMLVLLGALVLEIPGLGVQGSRRDKQAVCIFLGLWFVAHPLQIFVVLYDIQREAILACAFYFAALAAYVAGRCSRLSHPVVGYVLTGVLFLAGLMCKENVATLPAVLALAELTLFRSNRLGIAPQARNGDLKSSEWRFYVREVIRRLALVALIALPALGVYFLATHSLQGTESVEPQSVVTRLQRYYAHSGLSLMEVVLTECRVWFSYLAMIGAPFVSEVQLFRPENVSVSLWEPPVTFVAVAGVIGLIGIGLGLVRTKPVVAFGILFFVITLLPESLLIPTYLFFGYRAILPMAGILLALAVGLLSLAEWARSKLPERAVESVGVVILAIPLIGMGAITFALAHRWDALYFWQSAFSAIPATPRNVEVVPYFDTITGLGGELVATGRYEQAIEVLKVVEQTSSGPFGLARMPANIVSRKASALINLGLAHKKAGRLSEAATYYRRAVEMDPNSAIAWSNLGLTVEALGDLPAAMQYQKKAVELAPDLPEPNFNLGCLLLAEGKWPEAIASFEKAVRLRPDYPEAWANLGTCLLNVGRLEQAIPTLFRATSKLTHNAELFNTLGAALAESGRTGEAIQSFRKALEIRPDHQGAKQNLELLIRGNGRE